MLVSLSKRVSALTIDVERSIHVGCFTNKTNGVNPFFEPGNRQANGIFKCLDFLSVKRKRTILCR
jgi:hypothetical protein